MELPKEHPKSTASFCSLLFMSWINNLLQVGARRSLTGKDLYNLLKEDQTQHIMNEIEKSWRIEVLTSLRRGRNPRLWKALLDTFSFKLKSIIIILRFVSTFSSLALALLVWHFLKTLGEGSHIEKTPAILYMLAISIAVLIKTFTGQHYSYQAKLKGMRLKVAVIGLVYKKSILSCYSDLSKFSTGHILNLVSNDAQRMEDAVLSISLALTTPIEIVATIALLWIYIGWQSLSGVLYFVVLLVYNFAASKEFARLRYKVANYTDKRLAVLNNVICGIRTVKMYAWEWRFYNIVKKLRSKEMKYIRLRGLIASSFLASYNTATPTASLISILTLLYSGIHLSSFNIFTLLILLNVARFAITVGLSAALRDLTDAYVAVKRIEQFLTSLPELKSTNSVKDHRMSFVNKSVFLEDVDLKAKNPKRKSLGKALPTILRLESWRKNQPLLLSAKDLNTEDIESSTREYLNIKDVSLSLGGIKNKRVFHKISFNVPAGKFIVVSGAVGCGKSSLLMAILGEIPLKTGVISGYGSISYVSQIPWIFNGTIRDNILFGKPFHRERFDKVIKACDLNTDLKRFPKQDLSLVGQRGVSLSGGQRARVSLARALYSDADIFLLDDPLSSVDDKVAQKIFQECICGILGDKLRMLVTHQLRYLKKADEILLLKDGKIEFKGTYSQLLQEQILGNSEINLLQKSQNGIVKEKVALLPKHVSCTGSRKGKMIGADAIDIAEEDEDNAIGTVSLKTYWSFFRACSSVILILLLALFTFIGQISLIAPNWWLSKMATMPEEQQRSSAILGVFGGLITTALVLSVTRVFAVIFLILRSSENLHNQMVLAIFKSPVLFMDRNPVGRIMNRFSKDIGCVDEKLPFQFARMVMFCLNFASAIVLNAAVNVWMFVVIVPIVAVFLSICWFNLKTSRELKRLEAARCSPMYDHIADTINGLVVIRSFKKEVELNEQFMRYQDDQTKAFQLVLSAKQWLALYLDLLCVLFITCVGFGAIIVTQDAASTGLVITYAIEIIGETWFGIAMYSEVENKMTSVERIIAYTKLPSEPGYSRKSLPSQDWPSHGAISIRGLSFSYYEGGPRVLENIHFEVLPQQKIGIVGRTGAGKSSLVAALFRMPYPEGKVLIDGVDLATLDIQAARRAMAVITQDPVLFTASLRKNLDPFDKFDDQAIWTALEEVQLKDKITELEKGLDFTLAESGMSFSVGERQLVCLARALLQRSKILIMDEATANVDFMTDSLIQQVIRQKFTDCTVLTIAHRINTIMDYDKVLVLDHCHVVEYDAPRVLAGKQDGAFARIVRNHTNQEHAKI